MEQSRELHNEALAAALAAFHESMAGQVQVVRYFERDYPVPALVLEAELQAAPLADLQLREEAARYVAASVGLDDETSRPTSSFTVLRVRQEQVAEVIKKLESISRKAAKHGLPPVTADVVWQGAGKVRVLYSDEYGEVHESYHLMPVALLVLHGDYPRVEGYTVLGAIKEAPGGREFKGNDELFQDVRPLLAQTTPFVCDVCHTARRRSKVFLVRDDANGDVMLVGGECAKVFKSINLEAAISVWDTINNIREEEREAWESDGAQGKFFRTELIFAAVLAATRGDPDRTRGEGATLQDVKEILRSLKEGSKNAFDLVSKWSREAAVYAESFQGYEPANNFENSVVVSYAVDPELGRYGAPSSSLSKAIWAPKLISRRATQAARDAEEIRRVAEQKALVDARVNAPEVAKGFSWLTRESLKSGEKVQGWVTYSGSASYESAYGPGSIYFFTTADGFQLVWFTSGGDAWLSLHTKGKDVLIKATVKSLGKSRSGEDQAVVTRVTALGVKSPSVVLPAQGRSILSLKDVYAKTDKWVFDLSRSPDFATGVVDDEGDIVTDVAIYVDQKMAKSALKAGF